MGVGIKGLVADMIEMGSWTSKTREQVHAVDGAIENGLQHCDVNE